MLAIVNTIHASHTAGIVNLMVLIVYARSLAALGAKRTVAAFVGIGIFTGVFGSATSIRKYLKERKFVELED